MKIVRSQQVSGTLPKRRHEVIRWDGWGYKDCKFEFRDGVISFRGDRYPIAGKRLNNFRHWIEELFDLNLEKDIRPRVAEPSTFPEPIRNHLFLEDLRKAGVNFSEDGMDRVIRGHCQTLVDLQVLREHRYERIPDVVVWPSCHQQVVEIVDVAVKSGVVLIPVGGNTSVSLAVSTPAIYDRTIAVIDMTQMNRMLWVSEENLTACFEVGIVGQDIERELHKHGYVLGHEPDSHEFSTLGGWIATRASGMKKNRYGNIEDIVERVKLVTSKGVLEKKFTAPRVSIGPDFDHVILGSEGTLGIITEAVVKIRRIPEVRHYESLVFADLETGIRFLREVAERRLQPASIRLLDNEQFKCGILLDPPAMFGNLYEVFKRFYLSKICRFHLDKIVAVTLLFEGVKSEVVHHEKQVYTIAKKYGAVKGGEKNGRKGYMLTFVVAYIRDFAWDLSIYGESFETSVSWDKCLALCTNVKACIVRSCQARGIKHFVVSCRVTQSYDSGACVYVYFLFKHLGAPEQAVQLYEEIEDEARDEVLACGGTLSHHHGIGKTRSKWYPASVSQVGVQLFRAIKKELDPGNTFAVGNLIPDEMMKAKL
ncbi:alkyldihydroxyacetonephosphate synthase-like [Uranotaenia lowii]|uniref:alkyldihydroxyacetonephosphate synthase-like n=1 Tax=Uranotaenia lowii TaxID=190385 RepID=UPI00247856DE|nr:alkyldihydroxyacetonephosphate synthase-like [Uranotaenia lowii]